MKTTHPFAPALILVCLAYSFTPSAAQETLETSPAPAEGLNLIQGFVPVNPDRTVNMVVEIPAGTNEKWEVDKADGRLKPEFKNGQPRIIRYLGYPANYGMIPRTILPKDLGGDGDPLDIIAAGKPLDRGRVVRVKLIGVLRFLDRGEKDDKLIAVVPGTALDQVDTIEQMEQRFPGIIPIIRTWFLNYKGPGKMVFQGAGSVKEAQTILDAAVRNFRK